MSVSNNKIICKCTNPACHKDYLGVVYEAHASDCTCLDCYGQALHDATSPDYDWTLDDDETHPGFCNNCCPEDCSEYVHDSDEDSSDNDFDNLNDETVPSHGG